MFFNKKLHAKIAALESVVSRQTNTIDQLILDKRSLQRQVTDLHAQREVLSRRVTPDSSKQFHPMGNQNAVKKTLAPQTASTNPVVSQKTAETVDKDCGNCKKFSTNSLTGGPVCISCKDYSNWEPKP